MTGLGVKENRSTRGVWTPKAICKLVFCLAHVRREGRNTSRELLCQRALYNTLLCHAGRINVHFNTLTVARLPVKTLHFSVFSGRRPLFHTDSCLNYPSAAVAVKRRGPHREMIKCNIIYFYSSSESLFVTVMCPRVCLVSDILLKMTTIHALYSSRCPRA